MPLRCSEKEQDIDLKVKKYKQSSVILAKQHEVPCGEYGLEGIIAWANTAKKWENLRRMERGINRETLGLAKESLVYEEGNIKQAFSLLLEEPGVARWTYQFYVCDRM